LLVFAAVTGILFSHTGALFLHGAHLRIVFHQLPLETALADALGGA
jgi:hypothetical protein